MIEVPDDAVRSRMILLLLFVPWLVLAALFVFTLRSIGKRPRLVMVAVLYVLLNVCVPALAAYRYLDASLSGILLFLVFFRGAELEVLGARKFFLDVWRVDPADVRGPPERAD